MLVAGCSPAAGSLAGTETAVAAKIYATLTASAPMATLTPMVTLAPTPTQTSIPSPQPTALAVVRASQLNVREGPGTNYAAVGTLGHNDTAQVTGRYGECDWLQIEMTSAGKAIKGWIKAGDGFANITGECAAIPPASFRPLTGMMVVKNGDLNGLGTLTVENTTTDDGVAVLADMQEKAVVAFYLRNGEKYTLTGIPDAIYKVFFMTGQTWDWANTRFGSNLALKRFKDPFSYITNAGSGATWSISLQAAQAGAANVSDVDAGSFPSLK